MKKKYRSHYCLSKGRETNKVLHGEVSIEGNRIAGAEGATGHAEKGIKAIVADLKMIYTAPSQEHGRSELDAFETKWDTLSANALLLSMNLNKFQISIDIFLVDV